MPACRSAAGQSFGILKRVARSILLMIFAASGTILLVRWAPGFFSDPREMDARYAAMVQADVESQSSQPQSVSKLLTQESKNWFKGDLGESRQYHVPVRELVGSRVLLSALLLAKGIGLGWLLSIATALPVSGFTRRGILWGLPFTALLAIPTAAMATACILSETGGPVLVLSLLIAARDYKLLRGILDGAWRSPHLLMGRARGLPVPALIKAHLLPNLAPQLFALATLSIVTALGALVPIEVIFTAPGVGQLAWSAVMNRDLPVLVAVSILMACAVAFAGMLSSRHPAMEAV